MNNTTGQTPGIANTASGAADLPEALIGAIMAAAYDFRDAHISGSKNLKRTAHAELESMVRNTLHALAAGQATAAQQPDSENLRKALQFYADSEHFIKSDGDAWDTVSDEPQNYWCDEAGTATVEDGHIARLALSGHPVRFEDDAAQPAAQQPHGVAEVVTETVKFSDQSAADPLEKARRYLTHIANKKPNNPYFFDDGYPRESIADDAAAALSVLEQLAASHGQAPAWATEPTEQQILEAAFAPAQPAIEASRFGSPELQAMIIARCVEKDQADSVQEDAARYRYLRDGDWREHEKLESVIRLQLNALWDETIDAARKQGEKQ